MKKIGPQLESLLHRIMETPQDFLSEPKIGTQGTVYVPAVVQDLLGELDREMPPEELFDFYGVNPKQDRNRLIVSLIFCWLLADDWFVQADIASEKVLTFLKMQAQELASQVSATKLISDPDRREEMARLSLAHFGFRPEGESETQAQDRLASLSSIERSRILEASRAAEQRSRAIREALRKKAAAESADKWTRE